MASTTAEPAATSEERDALRLLEMVIVGAQPGQFRLVDPSGIDAPVPETVMRLLHEIVGVLAQGRSVTLVPHGELLTTQQAAEILHVSRPYLIQLLEGGELPYTMTGTHRRVRFDDVMAYKRKRDLATAEGLRELVRISEEAGLYDLPASAHTQTR